MVGRCYLASGQELDPTLGRWGASVVFWLQGKFGRLNQPFFLRRGWWVEGGLFSLWAALEEILSIGLPRCFVGVWIGIHLGHVFLGDQRADPVGVFFVVGPCFLRHTHEVGFSTNFKLKGTQEEPGPCT